MLRCWRTTDAADAADAAEVYLLARLDQMAASAQNAFAMKNFVQFAELQELTVFFHLTDDHVWLGNG